MRYILNIIIVLLVMILIVLTGIIIGLIWLLDHNVTTKDINKDLFESIYRIVDNLT